MKTYNDLEERDRLRSRHNESMPTALPTALPAGMSTPTGEPAPQAETATGTGELPPIMDSNGDFSPDWYNRFEDLEPYAATLAKFHRPEALAKSYAHLERLKGYPGLEDTRRMAAFRSAVGLPPTAEEFCIPRPEGMPDEVWDENMARQLARVAYEYGVPALAVKALSESYAGESRRALEAYRQAQEEAIEKADTRLQEEWGLRYDDNMRTVVDFLENMERRTGVDVAALVENPALRANPDFAKLILAAATMTEEAPMRQGTPNDDRAEARRIAHDPAHPLHEAYMRTNHPQHRYANEQYDRLAFGRPL